MDNKNQQGSSRSKYSQNPDWQRARAEDKEFKERTTSYIDRARTEVADKELKERIRQRIQNDEKLEKQEQLAKLREQDKKHEKK